MQQIQCELCEEYKYTKARIASNGLYVTNLPVQASEQDLFNAFKCYGDIAELYYPDSGSYCLVHYYDSRPVTELLMYPVKIFGQQISLRRRHPPKLDEDDLKIQQKFMATHKDVIMAITSKNNFQDQVADFLRTIEADATDANKKAEVCRDLTKVLSVISPFYSVVCFGSSLNGLAFKHSDLDLFYGKEIQSKASDDANLFRKVKAILERSKLIKSFRAIPSAKVPILKFVHDRTGISCDLSFQNLMGVQNSRLIKFILSLDARIKPFFMIIKYWARLHSLTGKRLSNYALMMILVNFLQSLNDPIIPPLYELFHDGIAAQMIGCWNVAFDDDVTRLRPISNTLALEELLSRFFESVLKTDFDNYVICPLVGSLIHRDSFRKLVLPDRLCDYTRFVREGKPPLKVNSCLCLQDPLALNLNITHNVSRTDFICFKNHCSIAAKIISSLPPHLFLSKLLCTTYQCPQSSMENSWVPNPMHEPPLRPFMALLIPCPKNSSDEITWMMELTSKIVHIFRKVLKIDVQNDLKKEGADVKPGSEQTFRCKGSQILWVGRDKLWNKWYLQLEKSETTRKETSERDCDVEVVEVLEVIDISRGTAPGCSSKKRLRQEETDTTRDIKKKKMENDIILIDSEDTSTDNVISRTLDDEIKLTNHMVRERHALPADSPILDFICNICLCKSNVRIEISDRRSRNNYFSSLCIFLEDFINKHSYDG